MGKGLRGPLFFPLSATASYRKNRVCPLRCCLSLSLFWCAYKWSNRPRRGGGKEGRRAGSSDCLGLPPPPPPFSFPPTHAAPPNSTLQELFLLRCTVRPSVRPPVYLPPSIFPSALPPTPTPLPPVLFKTTNTQLLAPVSAEARGGAASSFCLLPHTFRIKDALKVCLEIRERSGRELGRTS